MTKQYNRIHIDNFIQIVLTTIVRLLYDNVIFQMRSATTRTHCPFQFLNLSTSQLLSRLCTFLNCQPSYVLPKKSSACHIVLPRLNICHSHMYVCKYVYVLYFLLELISSFEMRDEYITAGRARL